MELSLDNFTKDSKSKDGLQSNCKKCKSKALSIYYRNNPNKRVKRTKEQARIRHHQNKINNNFSRMIRKSLKGAKNNMSWLQLVPYTLQDLKTHLEKQFTEGMSWDNYGEWHIDHIKPVSSFNIRSTSDDDFKECWKLNNLQPLWELDNLKKGKYYCPLD